MDPVLAKYATSTVPRYTSYPTAPHFKTGFSPDRYRQWLVSLDHNEPLSIYLHVPYCRQLCWYCGCNMKLATRYAPVSAYVESLLAEIELVSSHLPGRMRVSHLHWGGGTPTALEPDDLERVMADLRTRFTFTADAELAIESDPRTLTDEMIERIGALGFTRASFGVQEFDPKVQAAINRIQPPAMVRKAVDGLRRVGVAGINFDLIYGLPHQTVKALTRTVETCIEMKADRIALFGYAHVPWMAKKQRMIDEAALPGPAERAAQAEAAARAFVNAGYQPIGFDHFARPDDTLTAAARRGELHRNFQGYTTDTAQTMIAFGATAIGRTPFGYVQNIPETGAWARSVQAGVLPIAKGHCLDKTDKLRAHVIERLMCDGTVDVSNAAQMFAVPSKSLISDLESLRPLASDGIVELKETTVRMTDKGMPLVRLAAAAFDTYRKNNCTRHSAAL